MVKNRKEVNTSLLYDPYVITDSNCLLYTLINLQFSNPQRTSRAANSADSLCIERTPVTAPEKKRVTPE